MIICLTNQGVRETLGLLGQTDSKICDNYRVGSTGGVYNVSAMYVNQANSALLIGTHFLGMLEYKETMDHTGTECLTTHDGPCNKALYNPLFDLVGIGNSFIHAMNCCHYAKLKVY